MRRCYQGTLRRLRQQPSQPLISLPDRLLPDQTAAYLVRVEPKGASKRLITWQLTDFVDHNVTDQSSVLRFVEYNWKTGRIGDDSPDARSGTLDRVFDFTAPNNTGLALDPRTGMPQ